jgi:hypothetical protein
MDGTPIEAVAFHIGPYVCPECAGTENYYGRLQHPGEGRKFRCPNHEKGKRPYLEPTGFAQLAIPDLVMREACATMLGSDSLSTAETGWCPGHARG